MRFSDQRLGVIEKLRTDNATLREALRHHGEEAAKLIQQRDELLAACEAAETMLRCLPETSTNANGTKPNMTTTKALAMVRAAITKSTQSTTTKGSN